MDAELIMVDAFPAQLRAEVEAVARVLPNPPSIGAASRTSFDVRVAGEIIRIPDRIYLPEPVGLGDAELGATGNAILHCLYTRHDDGYVRQRQVEDILQLGHRWVPPYVVQLIGEYVVEILFAINDGLDGLRDGDPRRCSYADFVHENPHFIDLTAQRVASYWNCYYRSRDSRKTMFNGRIGLVPGLRGYSKEDYPGFWLIDLLRSLR